MASTTLKRKARRNKTKVRQRIQNIKLITFKPVAKKVDAEEMLSGLSKPEQKVESKKADVVEQKEVKEEVKIEVAEEKEVKKEVKTDTVVEEKKPQAKKTAPKKTVKKAN